MTDYERGLKNALKKIFPNAKLISCWFYYAQAVHRRASKIKGFFKLLRSNETAKNLFHKFICLPLMRADCIKAAFALLKQESLKYGAVYVQFGDYIRRQWICREGPISICVYLEAYRTNNLLESYNSILGSKIPPSGCFYTFIQILQKEEHVKSREYGTISKGGSQLYAPQRKKYKEKNVFISKNQDNFEKQNLTVQ